MSAALNEVDAFLKELDDSGELPVASTASQLYQEEPQDAWNDEEVDQLLAEMEQTKLPPLPIRPPPAHANADAPHRMPAAEKAAETLQKASAVASHWLKQRLPLLVDDMKALNQGLVRSSSDPSLPPLSTEEVSKRIQELQEGLVGRKQSTMTPTELVEYYQHVCGRLQTQWNGRFVQLVQAKPSLSDLTSLDMTGASLDYLQAETLALTLPLLPNLKRFVLQKSDIEDGSLKAIIQGLQEVPLYWLNVAFCWNLKSAGVKYIALLLERALCLRFLDLSGICINMPTASFLAQALVLQWEKVNEMQRVQAVESSNGSQRSYSLEVLKLDMCSLSLDALAELVPGIQNARLRSLSMRGNGFAVESANLISPLLANSTIEKLDLSENSFRAPGAQRLTMTLKEPSSKIRELYLRNCDLEPVTLDLLGEVLQTHSALQLLDVAHNSRLCSSVPSMQTFAQALSGNQTLKSISLCKTGFTFESALVFVEAIPDMHLQRLDLRQNDHVFNPMRANMLNLGDVVLRQGQHALEFLSKSVTQALRNTQLNNAADSLTTAEMNRPSGPMPSEQAFAVLSALVAAMRLNKTLTHVDVLLDDESASSNTQDETKTTAVVNPQHVGQLVEEMRALCGRNVGNSSGWNGASNDQLDAMSKEIIQSIDAGRHSATMLMETLNTLSKQTEPVFDSELMQQLHDRCVSALNRLNMLLEAERTGLRESIKDQLGLVQSELNVVLERYDAVLGEHQ